METLYPAPSGVASLPISSGAASLLRWLTRWHSETGEVRPSTGYIAWKQKKSERTIYRWLSELVRAGLVAKEVNPGIERTIIPVPAAAPLVRRSRRSARPGPGRSRCSGAARPGRSGASMSGVVSGVVSGVPILNGYTQGTTTTHGEKVAAVPLADLECKKAMPPACPEVVEGAAAELVALGVAPGAAVALVAEAGEGECLKQIHCLPYRKAADSSAVLVASIRGRWSVPASMARENDRRATAARRAAADEARLVRARAAAASRSELLERVKALPGAVRESLEARALALWESESPAAAKLMAGRVGGAAVVQQYVLRLFESGEVGYGS